LNNNSVHKFHGMLKQNYNNVKIHSSTNYINVNVNDFDYELMNRKNILLLFLFHLVHLLRTTHFQKHCYEYSEIVKITNSD
jgi:hypothetical protein